MAKKKAVYLGKKEKEMYDLEQELINGGVEDYWDGNKIAELEDWFLKGCLDDMYDLIDYREEQLEKIRGLANVKRLQIKVALEYGRDDYALIKFVTEYDPELTLLLSPKGYYRSGNDFYMFSEMEKKFLSNAINFIEKKIRRMKEYDSDNGELTNIIIEFLNRKLIELKTNNK